jgi:outer membrane protein
MLKPLKPKMPNKKSNCLPKARPVKQTALLYLLLIAVFTGVGRDDALAQDTLSLESAIQQALEQNYEIQIARKNNQINQNNVSRGNAGFLPTLRLTANQTNEINNTRQEFLSGETINRSGAEAESFNSRAELRWTLFDGFRMFTSFKKLKQIEKQGKAQFQQAVQQQVAAIIDQYYQLVKLKQQLDTRKEALKLTRKRRSLAKTRMPIPQLSCAGVRLFPMLKYA